MKKILLLLVTFACLGHGMAQKKNSWSLHTGSATMPTDKGVARLSFPKVFKLFDLDIAPLRQELFKVVDNSVSHSTVISLPNADGQMEEFEVYEASNFEPALQARFPEIRAFSGRGITDRYAMLKLSLSPQGIQTMVFRADNKPSEFIEPYSLDHTTYAVFKKQRYAGQLPWVCSTPDEKVASSLTTTVNNSFAGRSTGDLKTMRLAQSCNAEYSNYFNATSAAQVANVLAAFNATLTRCNGCYEKDLAIHLNLIANTTSVIYYNPATDPYTTMANWNSQLQTTLTSVIGDANYDIGHMFGASGGGGNAGCIGCICVNGTKGSGITSPADAIPQGDNFDIDYVVHEVGHQMGGNHTFSMSNEGTGVNKEVGSGITIMGYAGITSQDVAPHSIDIYHEATIAQIQANLLTKTCPVTTSLAGNNATPVVAPVSNYIIPKSTPFALTGSATDADGDPITYCWEQNDNASNAQSGAASIASATKASGPNWLSFSPSTSPTRICPKLDRILAGQLFTPPITGGTAGVNIEYLSSVARNLNFRLTVRDNCPYSSTAPIKVGQTAFTDMVVTVNGTAGPFAVSTPNTAGITWQAGTTQNVVWTVNGSDQAPVSCANVKISLSLDGGYTWPVVLIDNTPNDGTETITVPNNVTTTARVKVEAVGNIFFDINNANFAITAPATGFSFGTSAGANVSCGLAVTATASLSTVSNGGFNTPINLTASGAPTGTTVSFSPNPVTPGGTTSVSLNNANTLAPGTYNVTVTGTAGTVTQTSTIAFVVAPGTGPSITAQPADVTLCSGGNATFTSAASGTGLSYQWQLSTDGGATYTNITGATATSYTVNAASTTQNNYKYKVIISTTCGSSTSNVATLVVNGTPSIATQPANASVCTGSSNVFTVSATGSGLVYQWQVSTDAGSTWSDISGANAASYTLSGITTAQNNYQYHVVITGTCPGTATSTASVLTVGTAPNITTQPADVTNCAGSSTTFTAAASGSGITYQWQVSTDGGATWSNIAGANAGTYSVATTNAMNGNRYRVIVGSLTCVTPTTSAVAILTVNSLPAVTSQPASSTLCAGSNVTFSSTATGTNITYQWQVSNNGGTTWTNINGATAATYTITTIAAGQNNTQYHVVVSGTCTPSATSSAATLTVISPVNVTTQPASSAVCVGSSVTLTSAGSGTGVIYQWQVSSNGGTSWTNISGATAATYTVTSAPSASNGNLYHVLMSNSTCTTPTVSNAAALTVNALPVLNAVSNPTAVCTGSNVVLTATGASTYSWTPGNLTGATVTVTPTVNPANPGTALVNTYTVTGTSTLGCVSTTTVNVTANPLPDVTITTNSTTNAIHPGQTVVMTANVTPASANTSYQWYLNGVTISGATSQTLVADVDHLGEYSVEVAINGECASLSKNNINVTDDFTTNMFIYPNPNNGIFQIRYDSKQIGLGNPLNVIIYDAKGARVYRKTFFPATPYGRMDINIKNVSGGVYFVDLTDGAGSRLASGKVVVKP